MKYIFVITSPDFDMMLVQTDTPDGYKVVTDRLENGGYTFTVHRPSPMDMKTENAISNFLYPVDRFC